MLKKTEGDKGLLRANLTKIKLSKEKLRAAIQKRVVKGVDLKEPQAERRARKEEREPHMK